MPRRRKRATPEPSDDPQPVASPKSDKSHYPSSAMFRTRAEWLQWLIDNESKIEACGWRWSWPMVRCVDQELQSGQTIVSLIVSGELSEISEMERMSAQHFATHQALASAEANPGLSDTLRVRALADNITVLIS